MRYFLVYSLLPLAFCFRMHARLSNTQAFFYLFGLSSVYLAVVCWYTASPLTRASFYLPGSHFLLSICFFLFLIALQDTFFSGLLCLTLHHHHCWSSSARTHQHSSSSALDHHLVFVARLLPLSAIISALFF